MALFHGKQTRFPYRSLEDVTPHVKGRRKENKKKQNVTIKKHNILHLETPVITTQENIALVQHGPEKNGMRPLPTYGICPPDEDAQFFPL